MPEENDERPAPVVITPQPLWPGPNDRQERGKAFRRQTLVSLLLFLYPLMAITAPPLEAATLPIVVFTEDFSTATLRHAIDEYDPNPGIQDWNTPEGSELGWRRGLDQVHGGTEEWLGWSITTLAFWSGDDDQGRRQVFNGQFGEVFAVADSDEAEDGSKTPPDGYNAFLRTPPISLTGLDLSSLSLTFHSNFRKEQDERAWVHFYFDEKLSQTFHIPDQNITLTPVEIHPAEADGLPTKADELIIEFAYTHADNNWWWAIDKIEVTAIAEGATNSLLIPTPPSLISGPQKGTTNESYRYLFKASEDHEEPMRIQVDWGDGYIQSWTIKEPSSQFGLNHTWERPGHYRIRARSINAVGRPSPWNDVTSLIIEGQPTVILVTPPYLQNVRPDGIVIMTESIQDVPLSVHLDRHEQPSRDIDMKRTPSSGGTFFHRALITDLEPDSHYHYWIQPTGGTPITDPSSFRTAPSGEVDFRFSVWSDSQGHNRGAWSLDPMEPTVSMMKHMVSSGVAFGLTAGDLAEEGASYSDTRRFYLDRVARHLGTAVPWFVAWGNHDSGDPFAPLRLASDMPSRFRPGWSPGHGSYSFTYSNCFFVCIDHFYQQDVFAGWLESQLASTEAQNARFRFLAIHVPPYCERWIDGSQKLREKLVPLLETYRVDFCFSGHTHEYERGELNHVHYLVTGGGSWLDHGEPLVKDWEHMFIGGNHDVPGVWRSQSQMGELGPPKAIVGGLFNEYALMSVIGDTIEIDIHGFHADGSPMGIMDHFSVQSSPDKGPRTDHDKDGLPDLWETEHGLDASLAHGKDGPDGDPDQDGQTNSSEYKAGTHPNDAESAFIIQTARITSDVLSVTWKSRSDRTYFLEFSTDLKTWEPLRHRSRVLPIAGQNGATTTAELPITSFNNAFVRVKLR